MRTDLLTIDYESGEVVLTPLALSIEVIRKYKTKKCKTDSSGRKQRWITKALAYVLFMYKIDSPYLRDFSSLLGRHTVVSKTLDLDNIFFEEVKFDEKTEKVSYSNLQEIVDWYKEAYVYTKQYKLYESAALAFDTLDTYYRTLTIDGVPAAQVHEVAGRLQDNVTKLETAMKKLDSMQKIADRAQSDLAGRSGAQLNDFNNPDYIDSLPNPFTDR